jgi:inner membrane protease subunit 1
MICELPHHTDRSEIGSAAAGRRLERAIALWIAAAVAAGLAGLAMRRRPVPPRGVRPRTDRLPSIRGCPLRRAVVTGDSMLPAFQPGDRILLGPAWRVRPGQIVGLADPRRPERLLVKRVRSIDSAGIRVEGDNPQASTDSRHFGPVGPSQLAGRVVYRYGPRERTGWWPD